VKLNARKLLQQGKLFDTLNQDPDSIDLNAVDILGRTVIEDVIRNNDESLAIALVHAGINIKIPYQPGADNHYGHGLLITAAVHEMYDLIYLLLEKGLDPSSYGRSGLNALGYVVQNKNVPLAVIQRLLKAGVPPDCEDRANEATPLIFALANNRLDIIKLLLRYGADPNFCGPAYRSTVLMEAAFSDKDLMFIPLLLTYGARKDLRNSQGKTAYEIAIESANFEAARLLQPQGFDSPTRS
jgi:ankyrin repeat protein